MDYQIQIVETGSSFGCLPHSEAGLTPNSVPDSGQPLEPAVKAFLWLPLQAGPKYWTLQQMLLAAVQ
jgi:hypothetical protein